MNLAKLFETQKVLRDRIGYNGEDRFEKLILALLVEIGECANEWRGFKFWSKNQEPRTEVECHACEGEGGFYLGEELEQECLYCNTTGVQEYPLLEEYVDGLHFILEIGLELNYTNMTQSIMESETIEFQFNDVFNDIIILRNVCNFNEYEEDNEAKKEAFECLWADFFGLGIMLGFTWEQIEEAYYSKNQVNHERQESGY